MKKILILGIGSAQVDAINFCKQIGLEVHACSNSENGAGRGLVDAFEIIDIKDVEKVYQYAKKNKIDIVYSVGSDIAMPTTCKGSERLKLPHFVSSITADICKNKQLMREHLGSDFRWNPKYLSISNIEDIEKWLIYPCIIKPVDSQGQRGVFLLKNKKDFFEYYPKSLKFSNSGMVILEEYINGQEISVNVHIVNKNIAFFQTTDRITFDEYPGGLVKEHRIPSEFSVGWEEEISELVRTTIERLGIKNGPAYFQIKISKQGPKLIEVAPRLDGCHMWKLIKAFCRVDLLEAAFRHLLQEDLEEIFERKEGTKKSVLLRFVCEKPEMKVKRENYDVCNCENVYWYYEDDEIVRSINGYFEKIGYYLEETKADEVLWSGSHKEICTNYFRDTDI